MRYRAMVWMLLALCTVAQVRGQQQQAKVEKPPAAATATATAPASSPATMAGDDFVIGTEDVLGINVWREPEMSRTVPVRPDGKISLPLLGEFGAAGSTAKQLEVKIAKQLEAIVTNPQVTVIVLEIRSQKYSIMGEVMRPGSYPLFGQMTLLDAVAQAGGLREFAKVKKMYVLRRGNDGSSTKIGVNYKEILDGASGKNIILLARDTIVVP